MTSTMGLLSCKERTQNTSQQNDFIEAVVCNQSDINDNEMKEVELTKDHKVLLVKQGGTISALGTKCTHYGAPLVNGALGNGRIRCPWHGACFNIKTGDIEDFPGLDSLQCYQVSIENEGQVRVRANISALDKPKRVRTMVRRDKSNTKTILVVGGGGAGATCVEAVRQEGFTGRVVLICKEKYLPYDRPKLSKAMDMTADKIALRSMEFYQSYDIEIMLNTSVTSLNSDTKAVHLSDGTQLSYDALLLATGSDAREMRNMPGGSLANILPLRSVEDANRIAKEAPGKRIVMLGNSFIGMEVAAYLAGKATSIAVVGLSDVPFEPVLGKDVGQRLGEMFTDAQVVLYGGRALASFIPKEDDPSVLGAVELNDGTNLPADICILGLGTVATTGFLEGSGITLEPRGNFVIVNKHMETNLEGVYAAGDIAATPLNINGSSLSNVAIGHWQVAHYHGKVAAQNMVAKLDNKTGCELNTTPFYWTVLFGKSLRYAGYGVGFDDVKVVGDLQGLKFIAYYLKEDLVIAVATLNLDPLAAKFAERLAAQQPPLTRQMLHEDAQAWANAEK